MYFRLIILFLSGLIAFIFLIPSAPVAAFGGYKSRIVLAEQIAPGHQLVISKRFAFPSLEFADPTSVIKFQILDQETSDEIASTVVEIYEDSDYTNPEITIQGRNVIFSKFDSSLPRKVIIIRIP